MKKIILSILLLMSINSFATHYYIAAPLTMADVNALSPVAGDTISFHRGETFYGMFSISVDATSGNPIVLDAYGTGANPIITGFTTVTAWTNLGSNIWESTDAVSTLTSCNVVSINGANVAMGRTPNAGTLYTVTSHTANTSLTCSALTGTPDWTGAEVVIRKARWIWQRANVTNQSTSTISYTDIQSGSFSPQDGWGFFFQDDAKTLDQQNEWYYNPTTKKIRIYSTIEPTNVKVSSTDYLLSCGSYWKVENIDFSGANIYALYLSSGNNITIQNCNISFSGQSAINMTAIDNSTISGNTISDSNNSAIITNSLCDNNTFTGNTISRSGMLAGMTLLYTSGVQLYGTGSIFQNNTVDYSGYNGIFIGSSSVTIKNNFINHSLQTFADGGGIYTAGAKTRVLIDGNIVLNTIGNIDGVGAGSTISNGIYLDMPSVNVNVINNTVAYSTDDGIFLNYSSYNDTISNNTSFANGEAAFYSANYTLDNTKNIHDIVISGNKFVAKYLGDWAMELRSGLNDIATWGITSDNNYFARPIDDTHTLFIGEPDTYSGGLQYKTLAEWQSFSGKDSNSSTFPFTVSLSADLDLLYNATASSSLVYAQWPSRTTNGTYIGSSTYIQPYKSIIVYREYSPPTTPTRNGKIAGKNGKALLNLRNGKIMNGK